MGTAEEIIKKEAMDHMGNWFSQLATAYEQWIPVPVPGPRPSGRYKHAAAVIDEKLYVYGGSRNGRYISDVQAFDFKNLAWSSVKLNTEQLDDQIEENGLQEVLPAMSDHSMVKWGNKFLILGGHSKKSTKRMTVRFIDPEKNQCGVIEASGKAPIARGGHSATLVGSRLIIFGGEDRSRRLLNDVYTLDLHGFLEGMAVLDFDMLCSTVALQAQGKWRKLETEEDDFDGNGGAGGGVFRMWEGEVLDCCEDRRIAVESACCPCYRFGKNMRRAGFGTCFVQGIVYCFIALAALLTFIAFVVTKWHCFLYLAVAFTASVAMYLGFFRTRMRKKFNIRGGDSFLDDCIYHLFCPCCTLCQESRTLEMNNVQDGTWHGRGDTICVGSYREGHKAIFELHPPPLVTTKLSDSCSIQKSADVIDQSGQA